MSIFRCFGDKPGQDLYAHYHDHEWGVPSYDDTHLFEMLILEGAQAGLNWETILKKRAGYRAAFFDFDVARVADLSDEDLSALCNDARIVRNRLKVASARTNAKVFLNIQKEYGSFARYVWGWVDDKPLIHGWEDIKDMPASTPLSIELSRDLKKRGMNFVGPTIVYAYMQAVGLINDHVIRCPCHPHYKSVALK